MRYVDCYTLIQRNIEYRANNTLNVNALNYYGYNDFPDRLQSRVIFERVCDFVDYKYPRSQREGRMI